MKIANLTIAFLCCLSSVVSMNAQTVRDVMKGNEVVFELINDYIENSNLTENYAVKVNTFKSLFASSQCLLYMDHLYWINGNSEKRQDSVNLMEYCKFYQNQQGSFQQGTYKVSDVKVSMTSMTSEKARYKVELKKSYKLKGKKDSYSYILQLNVVYSYAKGYARINRISCTNEDERMVPSVFAAYVKKEKTLCVPKTIKMERFDQKSIIKLGETVQQVSSSSFNKLKSKESRVFQYAIEDKKKGNFKEISVVTIKNAVGLEMGFGHYLFSPVRHLNMEGDFGGTVKYSNYNFHVGMQYLRQLYARNRHRISFEIGLQLAFHQQKFNAESYQEEIEATDVDGDNYIRKTAVSNYVERSRAWGVSVPVVARYDLYMLKDLSVFVRGGLMLNMLFLKPISAGFDAVYAGQYGPELFNMYIDRNGYYDFGCFEANSLSINAANSMSLNMGSLLSLGLQYHITGAWSIEALASWQYMFALQGNKNGTKPLRLTENNKTFQSVNDRLSETLHIMDYQIRVKYNF